jgi:hypothetical protein
MYVTRSDTHIGYLHIHWNHVHSFPHVLCLAILFSTTCFWRWIAFFCWWMSSGVASKCFESILIGKPFCSWGIIFIWNMSTNLSIGTSKTLPQSYRGQIALKPGTPALHHMIAFFRDVLHGRNKARCCFVEDASISMLLDPPSHQHPQPIKTFSWLFLNYSFSPPFLQIIRV